MSSERHPPFIGSMTRLVWQHVRRQIHEDVVAAGYDDLNPAHLSVFRFPSPEGMRPSDLADEMQITKQSVNQLLGHLERHGYLVREPDPVDNRSRRIRFTELGRELNDIAWRSAERAERAAGEVLGEDRLQEFRQTLSELVALAAATGSGAPATPARR